MATVAQSKREKTDARQQHKVQKQHPQWRKSNWSNPLADPACATNASFNPFIVECKPLALRSKHLMGKTVGIIARSWPATTSWIITDIA